MFPVPMTDFPPQEVLQSMDSGETYPIEWWWNNYVLTGNPDGTYTATIKSDFGYVAHAHRINIPILVRIIEIDALNYLRWIDGLNLSIRVFF